MRSDMNIASLQLPEQLANLATYEFFEYDVDAEIMVEYNNTGRLPDYKYWVKLDDLVHGIQHQLNGNGLDRIGVYMASTTLDQKQTRDALVRNLKHRGFEVFPKQWLDPSDPNIRDTIKSQKALMKTNWLLVILEFGSGWKRSAAAMAFKGR